MSEKSCTYRGNREEALVAHLYDDGDHAERAAFDAHLAGCFACREELAELVTVRSHLAAWSPPEPARALASEAPPKAALGKAAWTMLAEIPVWAQIAAAVLCVGIAAGIANLQVRYDGNGLSVRTGWRSSPADASSGAPAAAATPRAPVEAAAWQADLAALEEQLRAELRAATSGGPRPAAETQAADSQDILRRVRTLVDQSERRQQRELALRVGELLRDVQTQRTADLVRIDRTLGYIQNGTGAEVMRQRRMLNDLAVRVTQRP